MARSFKGQVHVRLSPDLHEKVAKEAFEKGTSISGIIAQSITAREVLKNIDPWKLIDEIWEANRNISHAKLDSYRACRIVDRSSRKSRS